MSDLLSTARRRLPFVCLMATLACPTCTPTPQPDPQPPEGLADATAADGGASAAPVDVPARCPADARFPVFDATGGSLVPVPALIDGTLQFLACDDGNPCTDDRATDDGCVHTPHDGSCTSASGACAQCSAGKCSGTLPGLTRRSYAGAGTASASSALALADGGFVLAGYTVKAGLGPRGWLARLDACGDVVWQHGYDNPGLWRPTRVADHLLVMTAIGVLALDLAGTPKWQLAVPNLRDITADGDDGIRLARAVTEVAVEMMGCPPYHDELELRRWSVSALPVPGPAVRKNLPSASLPGRGGNYWTSHRNPTAHLVTRANGLPAGILSWQSMNHAVLKCNDVALWTSRGLWLPAASVGDCSLPESSGHPTVLAPATDGVLAVVDDTLVHASESGLQSKGPKAPGLHLLAQTTGKVIVGLAEIGTSGMFRWLRLDLAGMAVTVERLASGPSLYALARPAAGPGVTALSVSKAGSVRLHGIAADGQRRCAGAVDCDDSTACTVDTCTPDHVCAHVPSSALCDDGDACTVDTCDVEAVLCRHVADKVCSDGNPCTLDVCDPKTGACAHPPTAGRCPLGTCGLGSCSAGACQPPVTPRLFEIDTELPAPLAESDIGTAVAAAPDGTMRLPVRGIDGAGQPVWASPHPCAPNECAGVVVRDIRRLVLFGNGSMVAAGQKERYGLGAECLLQWFDAAGKPSGTWTGAPTDPAAHCAILDVAVQPGPRFVAIADVNPAVKDGAMLVGVDGATGKAAWSPLLLDANPDPAVVALPDGGYFLLGVAGTEVRLRKLDAKLAVLGETVVGTGPASTVALALRPAGGAAVGWAKAGGVTQIAWIDAAGTASPAVPVAIGGGGGPLRLLAAADGSVVAVSGKAAAHLTAAGALAAVVDLAVPHPIDDAALLPDGDLAVVTADNGKLYRLDAWGHGSCSAAGACAATTPAKCGAGNGCVLAGCSAGTGCQTSPKPDGAACGKGAQCKAGACP